MGGNPNIYAVKVTHFMLAVTSWMLSNEFRNAYYIDDEFDHNTKAHCVVYLLRVMASASQFENSLESGVRRVLEMSSLLFLERLTV